MDPDPDPGGPKIYGFGSGSATLLCDFYLGTEELRTWDSSVWESPGWERESPGWESPPPCVSGPWL